MSKNLESKPHKKFEKKLGRELKTIYDDIIKEKLKNKQLDYDTVSLILEVFNKSNFQWRSEHFDVFDSSSDIFRGCSLPKNYRECVMLGVRLGTMRGKIIFNLRGNQITEKQKQEIDDLTWKLVWYSWQEARMLYDNQNDQ
ncbi:hypothetical protein [Nitrosopumilus sp.]|uniref:hypothetical protein n=1 Tax=Nitrosopumilus sp. TaxID=2024843 RepID=UPI00247B7BE2|nr:hypothetical protein [Nitrosopumilus sp.]MCV0430165.1 hypothetical protein [Nitrosopumilus sp.]